MSRKALQRYGKRTIARLRAIRNKAAEWRRRARRAMTLALIAAGTAAVPSLAMAQMGQMGMAPSGGLVNRAVSGLQGLNANSPGFLYYGVNAADRGLGYIGSYMTVGGFVPYAEDDLGGLWSADLRGHLSVYGGFFSNVGFVRKQFVGGSLLGVGVYWDYDGDLNQYSDTTISDDSGSYVFAGGQAYQQVGVSGEWLTDWGNLRSNGYIPAGSTASVMGPFVGYSLLTQNGINAALGGADLELGAYIPGLSDWAGMVSVGGYALGNARYEMTNGAAVVPWFGGVYTRLDMTFIENWDFSLQANNDSQFDWTGFARLTYRMGGSRRRNVPDQMEQPMMRNEHIVRVHQAPIQAINPSTSTPWRVVHVDNSAAPGGNGTAEAPFTTLADAEAAATSPYDIVFVDVGMSQTSPYAGGFTFQADNQYLVGEGTSLKIPTTVGLVPIWPGGSGGGAYPVITAPPASSAADAAIVLTNGAATNTTVDHLRIQGAPVGISDGLGLPIGGLTTVSDVQIVGTGPSQTGVVIQDAAGNGGTLNFSNMALQNLTADGFVVDGQTKLGVSPRVNITGSRIENTTGSAVVVNFVTGEGRVKLTDSTINGTTENGVTVTGGNAIVQSTRMTGIGLYGVSVEGTPVATPAVASGTSTVQVVNSTIEAQIGIQASAPNAGDLVNITANQNRLVSRDGGNGINLAVNNGKINANLVGNEFTNATTTAFTTGTAGGTATAGVSLASDIFLTTSNTTTGLNNLTIKAAGQDNLRAINNNGRVTTVPPPNPLNTGTSVLVAPPPPPNYNPSATVPLPLP